MRTLVRGGATLVVGTGGVQFPGVEVVVQVVLQHLAVHALDQVRVQDREADLHPPQQVALEPVGLGALGGGQRGGQASQAGSGGGLGDRLAGMFGQQRQDTPQPADDPSAYPDVAMEDQRALLLIRAMIAAANADGEITADERQRILAKLDEAGAGPDEKTVVERELASPMSTDALVREVRDPETAEQVYLASALAIEPDTAAERSYLQYLAARLNLDPQRAEQLHKVA